MLILVWACTIEAEHVDPPTPPVTMDTGFLDVCLDDGPMPAFAFTWDEAIADPRCLITTRCTNGLRAVTPSPVGACFGGLTGWYDPAGARVALQETTDFNGFCGRRAFERWWGSVVDCEEEATAETAACALPLELLWREGTCLQADAPTFGVAAMLGEALSVSSEHCSSVGACEVDDIPAIGVVTPLGCSGHRVSVYEKESGGWLASAEVTDLWDGSCDSRVLWFGLAAWPCLDSVWAPTDACGVVGPP